MTKNDNYYTDADENVNENTDADTDADTNTNENKKLKPLMPFALCLFNLNLITLNF